MHILRHSKIAVTTEIYTEAPSDATRDALGKLSDWLVSWVGDTGIGPVASSV